MGVDDLGVPDEDCVVFVNRFTVHASPEEFERVFSGSSAFMASQPGFRGHTLVRHVDRPDCYVNIALWADAESFQRAVRHPDFAPHARAIRALATSDPQLYQPRLGRGGGIALVTALADDARRGRP